jgi:hypothetical protein
MSRSECCKSDSLAAFLESGQGCSWRRTDTQKAFNDRYFWNFCSSHPTSSRQLAFYKIWVEEWEYKLPMWENHSHGLS